jgi:phosphoglycolate phosphatase
MSDSRSVLVLFDIDGTLITTAGAGVRGMSAALLELHGREAALDGVRVSGRTDRAILTEIFRRWDLELTDDHLPPIVERYLAGLTHELAERTGPDFGILPGVIETLDALEADSRFSVGLLTGNFAGGAEVKLRRFDLWRRFAFGAFGDDHTDRRDLVPLAIGRAREQGIRPGQVIVIGDTPLDVDCAHAHGALAVAVATGEYSRAVLEATGAALVVDSLVDLHPAPAALDALCRAQDSR